MGVPSDLVSESKGHMVLAEWWLLMEVGGKFVGAEGARLVVIVDEGMRPVGRRMAFVSGSPAPKAAILAVRRRCVRGAWGEQGGGLRAELFAEVGFGGVVSAWEVR
eukprot:jgi/Tetstr1/420595/TSEL_011683.t1